MILREIILKCSLPDVTVGNIVNIWLSFMLFFIVTEAVSRRGSVKKVFLKISQNSQEKTRAKLFFCEFCKICLQYTHGGCFCCEIVNMFIVLVWILQSCENCIT